ncbi:hypothetical protein V501_01128 [Pseudogymnoascus sp. VKM F-4519 (FW-2642)]|nr:hypothetical protein V501_01128 [Pseudogymnoascus sp. VKM F-4519 (FW-2642)]
MCTPMSYDDVAWEKGDDVFDAWKHKLYRNDVLQAIGGFVQKHRGGVATKLYIARHLFRKLATEHRLTNGNDKTFKLFCDDLGPHNVLVDAEFKVVAVIDWEFAYSAPSKFSQTPPWWLLIQMPEQKREQVFLEEGRITKEDCLSHEMRQNWDNGDFWVHYAARKSWAVDAIYWSKIDERFFGARDSFEGRLALLNEGDRKGIDAFLQRKTEEQERRILIDWDADGVASSGNEVPSAKAYALAD